MSKEKKLEIYNLMQELEIRDISKEDEECARFSVLIFISTFIDDLKKNPAESNEDKEAFKEAKQHLELLQTQATIMPNEFWNFVVERSLRCVKTEEVLNKDDDEEEEEPIVH